MRAAKFILLLGSSAALACSDPDPGELHARAIVIDGHSDTTPLFEDPDWNFAERQALGHMDLPRIREGGLDAQFFALYLREQHGPAGTAIRKARQRLAAVEQILKRYSEALELARRAADVRRIASEGKLAVLIGIEGGHIIEGRVSVLREFHQRGVRYLTLTHSFHNDLADSSGIDEVPPPRHGGLSAKGEEIVRELNALGMMIDLSHVSDQTFDDTLRISKAPVIASHSSCRALADHPRNLSDAMLRALRANGGVVMLNFYPGYLDARARDATRLHKQKWRTELARLAELFDVNPVAGQRERLRFQAEHPYPTTSLEILLDHFDHAIRVAGPDHVGLGADWDGVPSMPEGLEDVSRLPNLTRGLLARGHSARTVRKVLGENLLRVMAEVEAAADRIGNERSPG